MKNVITTLQGVQEQYRNFNLLLPAATDVQLNPFYKYRIEEVPVDTSENSGDIFKVGSVKEAGPNGRDVYVDVFSLSKPLLNKLAMAAGIQFNPKETYGERVDRVTYRAQAQGAMRKADGSVRTETDQKVICLEDEEEKYRIEFMDKAAKGISDSKQAKAAAEIFSGKWVDGKDRYGNTTDRNGTPIKVFVIDEKDRDRYVERSVMVNMALLKKTWAEKAMTGAKLRVIRALLGLKGTYTKAELMKNFAITTVVFAPDYTDPQVRQMMIGQGMASVNNMFGTSAIPVKQVQFEENAYDVEADMNNAAFQSDDADDESYEIPMEHEVQETAAPEPPVYQEPEPEPSRENDFCCDKCGAVIPERVWNFSYDKYQRPLCMKCQNIIRNEQRGGSSR